MKKKLRVRTIILTIVLTGTITTSQAWATSNVLFIIDVSDRMSGKFPNFTKLTDPTKMQMVTESFQSMLTDLPKAINVGLEVYGHHGDKDCAAIDIMNPVQPLDETAIMDNIRKLEPERGSMPLAKALEQASEVLKNLEGDKSIVIFADGKDSCGGQPDEVVKNFQEQGITIHVLGIDLKDDETSQLSSIALAGNGMYHPVNNPEDLEKSLTAIKEKLIDKKIFFRDDFTGASLSAQWNILNPDKNSISIKNGMAALFVTATQPAKASNTLRLTTVPSPEEDWTFSANFNAVPQSTAEVFELGVSNENGSQQIVAQIQIELASNILLRGVKSTNKSSSYFYKKMLDFKSKNLQKHSDIFKEHIKSITIRLQKSGKEYHVSAKLEPFKEDDQMASPDWITLQKFTSPPLPDDTFFIRTYLKEVKNHSSKSLKGKVDLNWVEVQTMKHSEN